MEDRLRSHYESLSRVIGFTRAADAKAAPVLALQVVLLGGLTTRFEDLYEIATSALGTPSEGPSLRWPRSTACY